MNFLLHHLLRDAADRRGEHEGLICGQKRYRYDAAWTEASAVAAALRDHGLARFDRVLIWLPPSVHQALAIFAISAAGGVAVPLHESLFPRQIAHVAQNCRPRVLVTTRRHWKSLKGLRDDLSSLSYVVLLDGNERDGNERDESGQRTVLDWSELVGQPARWPCDTAIGKDLAAILYTSGSTGRPKGVMLSHANLLAGASIVSSYLELTPDDRLLGVLPLSFDAGLNQLTTAVQQTGSIILFSFVLAKQIVQALQQEQITGLAGVPTLWNLVAQNKAFQQASFPTLRYITNTGGAMPQATLKRLRESLPRTDIFLMYGLTEAFRSTYLPPAELERRPGSIGKAIPNTEILVVNAAGQPCGPGEVGELVHHGPTVSLGYWDEPELTHSVLRPHPFPLAEQVEIPTVCYSGDLVRGDEEGFLYFVSRRDNQIKSSGFRVSPTEVEEVLYESGFVGQAAVIGVPDELLGERIEAIVVAKPDVPLDPERLRDHCAGQLPAHMVPKQIWLRDHLPLTSSGKTDYAKLRNELRG